MYLRTFLSGKFTLRQPKRVPYNPMVLFNLLAFKKENLKTRDVIEHRAQSTTEIRTGVPSSPSSRPQYRFISGWRMLQVTEFSASPMMEAKFVPITHRLPRRLLDQPGLWLVEGKDFIIMRCPTATSVFIVMDVPDGVSSAITV